MIINSIKFLFFAEKSDTMGNIFQNVKTDRQFNSTTGYTKLQFYDLVYEFDKTEEILFGKKLNSYEPAKKLGAVEERLFFVLYYLKTYPAFDVLGVCFGMDGSNAERNIKVLLFALEKTLGRLKKLPARTFRDKKEMEQMISSSEKLLVDATERRVQRPENQADQSDAYSGKKKPIL